MFDAFTQSIMPLDFFRNPIRLLKRLFLSSFLRNFSTICTHMLSKFLKKSIQKLLIFPIKASFERSSLLFPGLGIKQALRKAQSFTLLEIIVCLLILSLAATAIGWEMTRLIAHHRFQTSAIQLYTALQEAQLLSMVHQTDSTFLIYQHGRQVFYQLTSHEPAPAFHRAPQSLPHISVVFFKGGNVLLQKLTLAKTDQPIVLEIFSSGRIQPAGRLQVYPEDPVSSDIEGIEVDMSTPLKIEWKGRVHSDLP